MTAGADAASGTRKRGGTGWELPRGPHVLPREVVRDNQRARLLAAVPGAVAEHGYSALTVEHIIKRASVSRATFYAHFSDKRDCVELAHERVFDRLAAAIERVCVAQSDWPMKIEASARAVVDFAVEAPDDARLLLLESLGADPVLAARARASTEHLVRLMRAGREQCGDPGALPEMTEQALVGSVASIIGMRVLRGEAASLPAIAPELIELLLIPYVGSEEARRLATAPA